MKRKSGEKLPCVVTFKSWQDYFQRKAEGKEKMELQKRERAAERLKKKEENENIRHEKEEEKTLKQKRKVKLSKFNQPFSFSSCSNRQSDIQTSDSDIEEDVPYKNSSSEWNEEFDSSSDEMGSSTTIWQLVQKRVTEFVVFTYENELFPGKIVRITDSGAIVSAMQKSGRFSSWPKRPDELDYEWNDILGHIEELTSVSSRRQLLPIPQLNFIWK